MYMFLDHIHDGIEIVLIGVGESGAQIVDLGGKGGEKHVAAHPLVGDLYTFERSQLVLEHAAQRALQLGVTFKAQIHRKADHGGFRNADFLRQL